jgi:predicted transcriptional regulator
MKASLLLNRNEHWVKPLSPVSTVEGPLLEDGYVVVIDGGKFFGILTPSDVIRNPHTLVVDCLTKKTPIDHELEIHAIHTLMAAEKAGVLPVFGDANEYLGSITMNSVLSHLRSMNTVPAVLNFHNVIGDGETEVAKQHFTHELYHSTKNPLQVIYSALGLLETIAGERERNHLLQSIYQSAKKIDDVIERLKLEYFA